MAIRVTHAKASTIAKFGIEAGKGEQRVRQEAEAQANARQQAAINAQSAANALRASTDIQKTILNAQSRQEAEQFESFMQGESAKRNIAWEQEKIEMRKMHDFDMGEQRRDIENQLKMADDQREKTKLQSAFTAIDNAIERGDLSPKEGNKLKLMKELGATGTQMFPRGTGDNALSRFVDELSKGDKVVSPVQQNLASLNEMRSNLSPENQKFVKGVIERADPTEVRATIDTLEATAQAGKTAKQNIADVAYLKNKVKELDSDQKALVQRALKSENPLQIEATASALREIERREKRVEKTRAETKKRGEEREQRREKRGIQERLGVKKFFDWERMSLVGVRGGI